MMTNLTYTATQANIELPKSIPIKFYSGFGNFLSPNNAGKLSGMVTEGITPLERCRVRLYYRPTGQLIYNALTDSNGNFSFNGLDAYDIKNYFAIAFDPAGGIEYNAIIFDLLTPTI